MSARCSADGCRALIQRLRNQVIVARWLGEQAVGVIRRDLAQAWEAGRVSSRTAEGAVVAEPADAVEPLGVVADDDAGELVVAAVVEPVRTPAADAVETVTVPFEGYDTLPANHIVQRLRRMTRDELRNAGDYEVLHRNRSTVLGMVEQLLDG
jgi:hypothetical protein